MCYTADEIFDGGLSDERGTRDYQRRHGYQPPAASPVGDIYRAKTLSNLRRALKIMVGPPGTERAILPPEGKLKSQVEI